MSNVCIIETLLMVTMQKGCDIVKKIDALSIAI